MTISWTCSNIFSTSAFVLPLTFSVSSDADALEMQQPEPTKLASLMMSPSSVEKQLQLVAAKRIVPLRRAGRRRHLVEIARLLAVVKNDLLIKVVDVVEHEFQCRNGVPSSQ